MKYVGIQTQIWRNNRNTVILLCMFPLLLLGMLFGTITVLDWLGFFCGGKSICVIVNVSGIQNISVLKHLSLKVPALKTIQF